MTAVSSVLVDRWLRSGSSLGTDDLLGTLVSDDGEDALDDAELNDMILLLFVAGFETTTNLIGNAILSLADHPEQYELLRSQPDLAANLASELLRHDTSVQLANRVATQDVEVGGVTIPAGDSVFLMLGAANRDPSRYEMPDDLDVTRTDVHPITFGGGIHHCLGAALATMEIDVLFREIASRYPSIDVVGDRPRHRDRLAFRGVATVELAVVREAAGPGAPLRPSCRRSRMAPLVPGAPRCSPTTSRCRSGRSASAAARVERVLRRLHPR